MAARNLRTLYGVTRSLAIYYGDRARRKRMAALYSTFVAPGDLVFDVGAHVGDRIAAFRSLGAHVVAVEPQPALMKTLKLLYGRDRTVSLVGAATGAAAGSATLKLNPANPTVSSASDRFIEAADGAPGWDGQAWRGEMQVPVLTLDALIARHGSPRFVKIDVEGFEAETLRGLATPVPALSFEFTTMFPAGSLEALAECERLGQYRYRASLGESHAFVQTGWVSAQEIRTWLKTLPQEANSGDIYAKRQN